MEYIQEPGTEEVRRAAEMADEVATSIVAEAELRSALARRKRDGQTWFYSADAKLNSAAKREGLKKVFPAGLS